MTSPFVSAVKRFFWELLWVTCAAGVAFVESNWPGVFAGAPSWAVYAAGLIIPPLISAVKKAIEKAQQTPRW
jgi:hypothetical protein